MRKECKLTAPGRHPDTQHQPPLWRNFNPLLPYRQTHQIPGFLGIPEKAIKRVDRTLTPSPLLWCEEQSRGGPEWGKWADPLCSRMGDDNGSGQQHHSAFLLPGHRSEG
ncbi:uncharacterized protein BO66DRAFT_217220 [Aspergillus aculeatinus CBS 121060]|uniref:Uncharacterized protein n=1 Tax=Aspergillus aculeatinus CBS 121060 TaxID=1448322 RepID=A0ACD1GV77_9EURO|nr:hypothetical protein BO66DRAFT_217220 [Aspergillus aculeatinus CBS 121060]RAH65073.1 hypothetical protein BO66DRAFT_217220 [Aspergillus aculeatinus CBS 121060]